MKENEIEFGRSLHKLQHETVFHLPSFEKEIDIIKSRIAEVNLYIVGWAWHVGYYEGAFPLIAKPNSQARCENFHPITIFESTRCELASWLLR